MVGSGPVTGDRNTLKPHCRDEILSLSCSLTNKLIMKRILFSATVLGLFAGSLLLSSCNNDAKKTEGTAFSLDSAKAAIEASNKVYGACFATGDSAKFAACYTADACINPPSMPRMCGTQAITAFFNGGYKQGIRNIKITTEEVVGGPDAVAEVGKYEVLGDKDISFDKGKFIVVWKQENGKWKMHRDEWNSDAPPPPPPPAK
jgi:ketosteroid isomerase-like protein